MSKGRLLAVVVLIPCLMTAAFGQKSDGALLPNPALVAHSSDDSNGGSKQNVASSPSPGKSAPPKHKIGPINISIDWRTRAEGWSWFQGNTGDSEYPFWHSLLRAGIGQSSDRMDWFVEGEQDSILGLPDTAVTAAPQGQLGLGGTYYAANHNQSNPASGFLKQAFLTFKHVGPATLKLGRFDYVDAMEVKPADSVLASVVQTRIANRLVSDFAFSAVQRSFDGAQLSFTSGRNNWAFLAARPTQGVFQVEGMRELDVDVYSGVYTRSVSSGKNSGQLRVFAIGYIDHRTLVLKTDNRPQTVRAGDKGKIEVGTYGFDYAHVYHAERTGNFDVLFWGAIQSGAWGNQSQHADSFVVETGWQPPLKSVKPWFSLGYSYGSGDGNPSDSRHGTFFQLLPTPRPYARFPFYNMMNNEDAYATLNISPASKLKLRSEAHSLRLTSSSDSWYLGGGAFQPNTFGYTGRPANGNRGLANVLDLSADYRLTSSLSTTFYYGHAWGKGVVKSIYSRNADGQFAYGETNFHF